MPMVGFDPNWGAIFCCEGAACGDICDPTCTEADPVVQERFVQTQHLGVVDFSIVGDSWHSYRCDDPRCCGDDDDLDD